VASGPGMSNPAQLVATSTAGVGRQDAQLLLGAVTGRSDVEPRRREREPFVHWMAGVIYIRIRTSDGGVTREQMSSGATRFSGFRIAQPGVPAVAKL
jgi:hypothetical protein